MKAFAITNLAATAAVLMGLLSPMAAARCMRDEDISKGLTPDQACSAHVKNCGPSECPKCEHNTGSASRMLESKPMLTWPR
ncbi:unnamed protein product [Zymoseptoria tritici ST99CH_3D7]|uniref:Uncharacterized protein n=1 Tax=Zymoseptoria tritici (strain ST99CH_3D7) TaxID=1276538 RepID=A0A1X7S8I7_ZYMT9|nr:unnamed protein product [Zymoseptoria tritici ST99CH_3D7]